MLSPRLASRLLQQTVRRYHAEGHFKAPTMDELPVPSGSWKAQYDKNQSRYNAILALGVGFSIFSIAVAKATGLVYLNYYPPQSID